MKNNFSASFDYKNETSKFSLVGVAWLGNTLTRQLLVIWYFSNMSQELINSMNWIFRNEIMKWSEMNLWYGIDTEIDWRRNSLS